MQAEKEATGSGSVVSMCECALARYSAILYRNNNKIVLCQEYTYYSVI